jgi:hypothetical protein
MKSVVIDNFFEDPHSVIEFAKEQTYYARGADQYYEGIRTKNLREINEEFYLEYATKLVYNYFDQTKTYKIDGHMNFHRLCKDDLQDPHWINDKVHKDDCILSNIVYLTPNAPMTSGTQIYRDINGEYVPDIIYHNKFNRLIQFPGPLPHSAMDLDGGDDERLTMLFFLEKIEEV